MSPGGRRGNGRLSLLLEAVTVITTLGTVTGTPPPASTAGSAVVTPTHK